jgi:hypothetical protein
MSATEGNHGDSHGPAPLAEPKTPMWLPALGAVLFLTVGLLWALSTPPQDARDLAAAAAASASAAAAPSAAPTAAPTIPQGALHRR